MHLHEGNYMNNLEQLKKLVHEKGFNISMMINLYKKKRREAKALGEIPEEIYCQVCLEYLKGKAIKCNFPYFMRVLVRKAEEYYAGKSQKYEKFGKMPDSIKSIMKGV